MGSKPSTIFRRVQPSLPYSFQYDRLSSSSHSHGNQQPLLADKDNNQECMEQLQLEIEANRKKNESLEIKNAALEKELRELRVAAISKQVSRVPPIVLEKNVASLEQEIHELKSAISRLQSRSNPVTPGTSVTGSDAALKKEVDKLENRVLQLELDSLMSVRKQDVEKVVQKNGELENRVTVLATTIHQLKSSSSGQETHLASPTEPEPGIQGHETNDLVSCLIVLIFLVSVLIGVHL